MSRTPEVKEAIRRTVDTYVCGTEGYAWRGTARILAAEVERLEGALEMGQRNCDDVYENLRAERELARQRAETAEARVAELEERLKGTLQAGGYQYFYEQLHAAEREAGNARYVAEQAQAKVAELEAQIAEVVGSQRNEDKSLPTWAQVMNRVALLTEQNARLRAALVRLDNIYRSELDGEDAPKRPAWLIAALNGEEAST